MQRTLILTKDGSHTVSVPELNVTYHSLHGAIQESTHVFIEAGWNKILSTQSGDIRIVEMGFGTGLNALLTLIEAGKTQRGVHYTTIELFPLEKNELQLLNYCEQLNRPDLQPVFDRLHETEWEKEIIIQPNFTFLKSRVNMLEFTATHPFNLIYFDAFAPSVQPELWTKEAFDLLYSILSPGGLLVTYCSKADVRRAMQAGGFSVEKIQGPWGKREMVRSERKF